MGKYMKKARITGDVGVMEVSQPTSLGVRTRAAKALALQRLNSSSASAGAASSAFPVSNSNGSVVADDSSCYLQLRSRRLEKPSLLTEPKRQQQHQQQRHPRSKVGVLKESGSRPRVDSAKLVAAVSGSVNVNHGCDGDGCFSNCDDFAGSEGNSADSGSFETKGRKKDSAEASLGENNLDFETTNRRARESTPCNIAGDLDTVLAVGSSTRQRGITVTNNGNGRDDTQRISPTTLELEEFFVFAEQQKQRLFMDKYNFDVVNDLPLPGRYEWVQVTP